MTIVADASVVLAAFVDTGARGNWAQRILRTDVVAAPHVMPLEVARVLRRHVRSRQIPETLAGVAHARLGEFTIALYAYAPHVDRIWELRENLTPMDAWYVAVAEALDAPLATLDRRLTRASGPRCRFLTPP